MNDSVVKILLEDEDDDDLILSHLFKKKEELKWTYIRIEMSKDTRMCS